jgi:TIR domain
MNTVNKEIQIDMLQRLLSQSATITVQDSEDVNFQTWKHTVERTFIKVFGDNSPELNQFKKLSFCYPVYFDNIDNFSKDREYFRKDFDIITALIKSYIEELNEDFMSKENQAISKVFISHSSRDDALVEILVELLESTGLPSESIFCTSLAGYGIKLGDNFLDKIRYELNNNTLVLFLLTPNFFASSICLCEMGATWALTKMHVPIVVPPLDYQDIKGVIPLTQGFKINDRLKLNELKEMIESLFNLQTNNSQSIWERKRDNMIVRINEIINDTK